MIKPLLVPVLLSARLSAGDRVGSRFTHLDGRDSYDSGLAKAKLTTPMWVGGEGVEAVVQLSIEDMGWTNPPSRMMSHAKSPRLHHPFLRPAIERLRRIDQRAPISIYTLQAQADGPWFQRLLNEGVPLEAHTFTHAVPYVDPDLPVPASPPTPMRSLRSRARANSWVYGFTPAGWPWSTKSPPEAAGTTPDVSTSRNCCKRRGGELHDRPPGS